MKKLVLTCLLFTVFTAGSALAADRSKDQDRTKDQKKDGTCTQMIDAQSHDTWLVARGRGNGGGSGTCTGDRDQRRDGSCLLDAVSIDQDAMIMAADQTKDQDRTKDQKKDGTCTQMIDSQSHDTWLAARGRGNRGGSGTCTGDRAQRRDGSCLLDAVSIDQNADLLAADQKRDRKKDNKKDGSCVS